MAKKQYEYKGHAPVYGPKKTETDIGSILGGVVIIFIAIVCLAQCSG